MSEKQTTDAKRAALTAYAARRSAYDKHGWMLRRDEPTPPEWIAEFLTEPANVQHHYMERAREVLGDE